MKRILLIAFAVINTIVVNAQNKMLQLDSLLNYYNQEYGFNGCVLVSDSKGILIEKVCGYRDVAKKIKHDKNSIFQMGSVTKQFTAEIILQLAEKNKLNLQDKLTKYFPGYPNGEKITIENLLTHTSGIFDYTHDMYLMRDSAAYPISMDNMLSHFKNQPLNFEPGTKYDYSNSNYILLGYIIEKVTGRSYMAVVRDNILNPAGMTHSGFDFTNLKDPNISVGYMTIQGDSFRTASIVDSSFSFAAGALYSTMEDMYKWHKALQSYKLLDKKWQEKAYVPFKEKYAYGWEADSLYGKRFIFHSGGIFGFTSFIDRVEEDDFCIIVMQNNMRSLKSCQEVSAALEACVYDKNFRMPKAKKIVTVPVDILKQYEGEYALVPGFTLTVKVENGSLHIQGTGQPPILVQAISETQFTSKEVGADIDFLKDEAGKYNKLILHQGGRDMPATKK